ncbi:hypothetical protein ONZ43_g4437 [Nemania bipapillata]|uniref:Uncharacterized protein n=1 Tax=Nemania bipapillata TaxID=110536 RepID=A0ACC2IN22_9PEZI|nr:hypothetical protein ONZ43_g4437 [Nemania bipapillata]
MSSTQWALLAFRVETTTPDGKTDTLYANGRMQAPVVISIKALDKSTQSVYNLSDSELDKIELIDYDAPTTKLADGWSYSAKSNDLFADSATTPMKSFNLLRSSLEVSVDTSATDTTIEDAPQKKRYMVSTTRVEDKRIGARIKLPDGTMVTTTTSPFNFYVTLVGKPPVVYTTDNITVNRDTVDKGVIETWTKIPWSQDNYYVSSKEYDFVKADIHDYDITGTGPGHDGDSRLANIFNYWSGDGKLNLSFIWGIAPQSTREVGRVVIDMYQAVMAVKIKVNQKSNALCLTRMAFDAGTNVSLGSNWSNKNCGFTVYDCYGNTGKFSASWSKDKDIIVIRDSSL